MIRLILYLSVPLFFVLSSLCFAQSPEEYELTVDALQKRYADEMIAHRKYTMYGERACAEGYPNIAHLFKALSYSEGIHARNFKELLSGLGAEPDESLFNGKIEIESTKYNLKHAANVERDEIDHEYPDILSSIRAEDHGESISSINYAWQAEKQHRDLILKIQKAALKWFGLLVSRIEGKESHYYVCQICGSTLMEKSGKNCPICERPMSQYQTIEAFAPSACPVPEDNNGFF